MNMWKKAVSIALASALVLGLCACNKEGGAGIGGNGNKKESSANAALAKEYVYRMDEFDFSSLQEENSESSIMQVTQCGERIYVVLRTYDQDWKSSYKMLSMNKDGSDSKTFELQDSLNPEEENEGSTESSAESTETTPIQPRTAEEAVEDAEAVSEDAEVDTDMSLDEEDYSDTYEDISFGNFQIVNDCLYASKYYTFEDYSDPDNYVSVRKTYVCSWDLEGSMLTEVPVELLSDESSWYYISNLAVQADGQIALLVSGDESGKIVIDSEGQVSDLQPMESLEQFFTNSSYSVLMPDGKLLLTYYNEDWSEMSAVTYDISSDTLTEPVVLPATMTYQGLNNLSVDINGDLLYSTSQGVFKYHIGDAEPVQMMSFVNSDLNITSFDALLHLDEERFVGLYSVWDEETYARILEGGIFTKVAPEDIPDKEVLVLGGSYIASDLRKRVVNYNKSSNTHRIVIKDYSQYNTNEDYMASYTQLNNDIIAGNMPDILMVDSYNMSLESYVSKGLLVDIGEMLANDAELSQVEYMENVFEACKVDGKLYEIIPAFYVQTYIAKTSLVGSRDSWTMAEAQALLAEMPEGTSLFGDMTREGFFRAVMDTCGRDFIDVYSGKCNFDSEEFMALMEFAKTLPEELGDDYYGEDWYKSYESQYREERTILSSCYISSMESMVYTINGSFGEEVSFVGMPTSSGQGSAIYTPTTYAISAKSANTEAAWEFLRYYLTDEYQETLSWQLPISEAQFDVLAQKAMKKPTYEDADGNLVEDEYNYWINDENITLDPLTQRQVMDIKDFISSVTTRAYYNEDILNIVTEEMDAFYQGQKSAADVAGIIQSRAQLFVNENR